MPFVRKNAPFVAMPGAPFVASLLLVAMPKSVEMVTPDHWDFKRKVNRLFFSIWLEAIALSLEAIARLWVMAVIDFEELRAALRSCSSIQVDECHTCGT